MKWLLRVVITAGGLLAGAVATAPRASNACSPCPPYEMRPLVLEEVRLDGVVSEFPAHLASQSAGLLIQNPFRDSPDNPDRLHVKLFDPDARTMRSGTLTRAP